MTERNEEWISKESEREREKEREKIRKKVKKEIKKEEKKNILIYRSHLEANHFYQSDKKKLFS